MLLYDAWLLYYISITCVKDFKQAWWGMADIQTWNMRFAAIVVASDNLARTASAPGKQGVS
jgi:hypothetical protein